MITVGIDTGIATMGLAAASNVDGRILALQFCGTVKDGELTRAEDQDLRVGRQCDRLCKFVDYLRADYGGPFRIVKENRSINRKFSATAKMYQAASAALIVAYGRLANIEIVSVSPKVWQRRMISDNGTKGKVDYVLVTASILDHIDRSGRRSQIDRITETKREHAIDACGMAMYGALYWSELKG